MPKALIRFRGFKRYYKPGGLKGLRVRVEEEAGARGV